MAVKVEELGLKGQDVILPENYNQISQSRHKEYWLDALNEELNSMKELKVFEEKDIPKGRKLMSTKYVFATKTDKNDRVERFKVRMVAKGFTQVPGIDYFETYSEVVKVQVIRFMFALAAQEDLHIRQLDIKTAYLYSALEEPLYMTVPKGYEEHSGKDMKGKCLRLLKALPGTKQGAKQWFKTCREHLVSQGYTQVVADTCVYTKRGSIVLVYVDDILVFSKTIEGGNRTVEDLSKKFQIVDRGEPKLFLQIEINRPKRGVIELSQKNYIEKKVLRHGTNTKRKYGIPIPTNIDYNKLYETDEDYDKRSEYGSLVGALLYAQQKTRPDISFAMSLLTRVSIHNSRLHWELAERTLMYLNNTKDIVIRFRKTKDWNLKLYVDASFGTGKLSRSITGYVITLNGTAIAWRTAQQKTMAKSTCCAEYLALSDAIGTVLWIRNLAEELGYKFEEKTKVFEDNESVIDIVKGNKSYEGVRYLEKHYHFMKEHLNGGQLEIEYIQTDEQAADLFTKPLNKDKTVKFMEKIGQVDSSNQIKSQKMVTEIGGALD